MDVASSVFFFENRTKPFIDICYGRLEEKGFSPHLATHASGPGAVMFDTLRAHYEHRSVNPAEFELRCLERYFAMMSVIPPGMKWLMLDSDVLLLRDYSTVRRYIESVDADVIGSVGFGLGGDEKQISPHFTLWDRDLAADFCAYVIEVYRAGIDEMIENIRLETGNVTGTVNVSDMVLLHQWVIARGLRLFNTNQIKNGLYIDHNISQLLTRDGEFASVQGVKSWRRRDELITLRLGCDTVEPVCLHFPGRYKKLIWSAARESSISYRTIAAVVRVSTKLI